MEPTPSSNTAASAIVHLEHTRPSISPAAAQQNHGCADPPPLMALPMSALRSSHPRFMHLAPETRNAIYGMVLDSPLPFFIVAADGLPPGFRLRERSDQPQYEAVQGLQVLSMVSREIRHETRTFFYALKHFLILPYGYEYLPVFVHWLDAIGLDCRAVLRNVCFAGYMWYQGSVTFSQQFHDLLRSCASLQVLTVQINVWHLCELCLSDLDNYLNFEGPDPHDGPMPEVNISTWASTIVQLPRLRTFRLDIVMSVDRSKKSFGKEQSYLYFITERCRALVVDVERRLRVNLDGRGRGDIEMTVRFGGTDERVYLAGPGELGMDPQHMLSHKEIGDLVLQYDQDQCIRQAVKSWKPIPSRIPHRGRLIAWESPALNLIDAKYRGDMSPSDRCGQCDFPEVGPGGSKMSNLWGEMLGRRICMRGPRDDASASPPHAGTVC